MGRSSLPRFPSSGTLMKNFTSLKFHDETHEYQMELPGWTLDTEFYSRIILKNLWHLTSFVCIVCLCILLLL